MVGSLQVLVKGGVWSAENYARVVSCLFDPPINSNIIIRGDGWHAVPAMSQVRPIPEFEAAGLEVPLHPLLSDELAWGLHEVGFCSYFPSLT